jgi:hypothetical protein
MNLTMRIYGSSTTSLTARFKIRCSDAFNCVLHSAALAGWPKSCMVRQPDEGCSFFPLEHRKAPRLTLLDGLNNTAATRFTTTPAKSGCAGSNCIRRNRLRASPGQRRAVQMVSNVQRLGKNCIARLRKLICTPKKSSPHKGAFLPTRNRS